MADKTITDLIADLLVKMSEVSEQGADLVRSFKAQAEAINEMKSAADNLGETLKNLGGIASQGTATSTGAWNGISQWDMPSMVGTSLGNSSNSLISQAQAAISSGQEINMQNTINSLLNTIQNTQKLVDSAKIQYDAAMAANNTQKALNIKQTSIDVNEKYIENAKSQMNKVAVAMGQLPKKTYRLEIKYNTGTQHIDVVGYDQAMEMIKSLGNAARLV